MENDGHELVLRREVLLEFTSVSIHGQTQAGDSHMAHARPTPTGEPMPLVA